MDPLRDPLQEHVKPEDIVPGKDPHSARFRRRVFAAQRPEGKYFQKATRKQRDL